VALLLRWLYDDDDPPAEEDVEVAAVAFWNLDARSCKFCACAWTRSKSRASLVRAVAVAAGVADANELSSSDRTFRPSKSNTSTCARYCAWSSPPFDRLLLEVVMDATMFSSIPTFRCAASNRRVESEHSSFVSERHY
jgi:hypothetical protein